MPKFIHSQSQGHTSNEETTTDNVVEQQTQDVDLIDEIDSLLGNNAEEFVRSYVQKGGQ